jgi:uncharacterized protein YukE
MAVEESIKIKIQANAEEFKIVSNIINTELGKLGKNFEILEGNIKQTSNAMKGFDGSSKKFNKGIMSISLILQDLPYGFRGIQNNIPALAQGFGVLYLAVSAVTAAMTYFVMQGDNMSKDTKKIYETFKEFINGVVNQVYNTLKPAFDSIVKSIMFLWDMFGNNLINQFKYIWENLLAFLKIAGNILAEGFNLVTSVIKGDWSKFGESLLNIFKYAWNAIVQFLSFSLKMVGNAIGAFTRIFDKDLGDTITKSTEYTANKFADSFKFAFKEVEKESKKFDIFSIFGGKKKGGDKNKTYDADTSNLELLKSQQKYYKDDLALFYEYGRLIIKEEERLALEKANFEKKSAEEINNIKAKSQADIIVNQQEFGRALMAIADKNTKDYEKNEEEIAKIIISSREQIADSIKKINSDMNTENIKNVQTELDQTLKATRGNYNAQKEAYQIAIDKLKEKKAALDEAGISSEEYRKKIENLQAGLGGLVDPLETLSQTLQSTFSQMNIDLVTGFAESIGEMLAGGKFDFTKLGNILADGLSSIGKALIAFALTNGAAINLFKDPKTWPLALAAGIAAVTAGSFLKNSINENKATAFANGGIVSGPTMGLVGEYPGAANNPEVIAPLDKLKSMIGGGGGGTFVLRGQDLLVSINRTQKSSFLKGQNISLA